MMLAAKASSTLLTIKALTANVSAREDWSAPGGAGKRGSAPSQPVLRPSAAGREQISPISLPLSHGGARASPATAIVLVTSG